LHDLIDYIRNGPFDIFSDPEVLFVLPDGISISNAKERIAEDFGSGYLVKIGFFTFEDLASEIVRAVDGRSEIVPPELRRLFIVESIRELAEEGNVLARNILSLLEGSVSPENEGVIKSIDGEFDDFFRCVYPPQLESETREYLSGLKKIADELEEPFYRESAREALEFYSELETRARRRLEEVLGEGYYLSRSHLVGRAAELLKDSNPLFEALFPNVSKLWVSSISVFDVPILELINAIARLGVSVRINTGSRSAERLKKRLQNGWRIRVRCVSSISESEPENSELVELPDMRREAEYVILDIARRVAENETEAKDVVVFARDIGQYAPYVEVILQDYGLLGYIQMRRSLALTPAFRLAASLLRLLALIEEDREIKPSEITDPLRLGFTAQQGRKPLSDFRFLWIENMVNIKGRGKPNKWEEWSGILRDLNDMDVDWFVIWVSNRVGKPSVKPIEAVLTRFEKGGSSWKVEHKSSTGFIQDRWLLVEEHITSHAHRITSQLHRVEGFARKCKEMYGRKRVTWSDLLRAFYAVLGSETYGVVNRDAEAVRFIEAGNSHFVKGKVRYVMGLRSGSFPRQCPSGVLLSNELRKKVNEAFSPLYLRGPVTDYENECDFYEAVLGPELKASTLIFTMPYMDDRGHKEEWSVFVPRNGAKPVHINASQLVLPASMQISPRARWRQAALAVQGETQLTDAYQETVQSTWTEIIEEEIAPRLEIFDRIVINRDLEIRINEKEEPYLQKFIDDVRRNPIPAHEINLYEECPLMYYFYKYLYCLGLYTSERREGDRKFIPEWKFDFQLGPIPLPVRRRHISTRMETVLGKILSEYNTSNKLKEDRSNIVSMILNCKGVEFFTKMLLIKTVDFLIELNSDTEFEFREAECTSLDSRLWRPAYIKAGGRLIYFAKCKPRVRTKSNNSKAPNVLCREGFWRREVLVPGTNQKYPQMKEVDYERFVKGIKSFTYAVSPTNWDDEDYRCKYCVYRSLCGDWGF